MPKYPEININLGTNENAIQAIELCCQEGLKFGLKQKEIDEFVIEAMSYDYLFLIDTCSKWFNLSKNFVVYRPKEEQIPKIHRRLNGIKKLRFLKEKVYGQGQY